MKKLSPRPLPEPPRVEPFPSAEEAWLWFWHCQHIRDSRTRMEATGGGTARPCDPDDIYRVVQRLQVARRLDRGHLLVMVTYGRRQRPPDPRVPEEAAHADLWEAALDRLEGALIGKGLVRPRRLAVGGAGHGG